MAVITRKGLKLAVCNLIQLNSGKAALRAADPVGRDRLVRGCKAERLSSVVTDLRLLVFG